MIRKKRPHSQPVPAAAIPGLPEVPDDTRRFTRVWVVMAGSLLLLMFGVVLCGGRLRWPWDVAAGLIALFAIGFTLGAVYGD